MTAEGIAMMRQSGLARAALVFVAGLCCGLLLMALLNRPQEPVPIPGIRAPFTRMLAHFADSGRPLVEIRDAGTKGYPITNAWSESEEVSISLSGPPEDPWYVLCHLYDMDEETTYAMGLRFLHAVAPEWNERSDWLRLALKHANDEVPISSPEFAGGIRIRFEKRRDEYLMVVEPDGNALLAARWGVVPL